MAPFMSPETLRDKMQKLADYIYDAEGIVRGGKMVDLSSLDREVSLICKEAMSLPAEDVGVVQPVMAELIGNLERLSMAIKDYKDNLKK